MKRIELVIPTIGRFKSLFSAIQSFYDQDKPKGVTLGVTVVVDWNRLDYHNRILTAGNILGIPFTLKFNKTRHGWNNSLNRVYEETDHDYYFYGSDDLTFHKNCVLSAYKNMTALFPDGDGLIGITQNLGQFCPAAFGLIGRKFINRFPDRIVMYPYYKHFCGDSELWHYAVHKNKFHLCPAAKVTHARPMDEGKKLANKSLRYDREIWWKKKGKPRLYWGNSFKSPAELKNEIPVRTWGR